MNEQIGKEKGAGFQFPVVTASNLLRHKLTLPADFEGELNILLVAFYQWHQQAVDTWIPLVKELEQAHDGVRYYEFPVIQRTNVLAQTFINEGMRAGIPNRMARERTITLYLDKAAFREALGLSHEEDIYVLLVDRQGRVLWRAEGAFTPQKGESLRATLRGGAR